MLNKQESSLYILSIRKVFLFLLLNLSYMSMGQNLSSKDVPSTLVFSQNNSFVFVTKGNLISRMDLIPLPTYENTYKNEDKVFVNANTVFFVNTNTKLNVVFITDKEIQQTNLNNQSKKPRFVKEIKIIYQNKEEEIPHPFSSGNGSSNSYNDKNAAAASGQTWSPSNSKKSEFNVKNLAVPNLFIFIDSYKKQKNFSYILPIIANSFKKLFYNKPPPVV